MSADNDAHNTLYRAHLVDAYLKRAGSFRKLLATLLGFTAAFGFLIAWPYLSAVQQEFQLTGEINQLDDELAATSTLHQRYQQPRQAVQQLQQMIDNGPPMLRGYIEFIGAGEPFPYPDTSPACREYMDLAEAQAGLPFPAPNMPAQMQQSAMPMQMQQAASQIGQTSPDWPPTPVDSCAGMQGNERSICRIDRFVQFQLCEYEQVFADRVLPALATLQDGDTPLFDKTELAQQFGTVREALHQHVAANPTFWRTYQGKGDMGVRLQDEVEQLWNDIAARMAPVIKNLDQRIASARERRADLKQDSARLVKQREELTTRLARIQSPIGNLPVGLTESVLLFPIVLAIGFGMASAGLLEQLRLRRALRAAEQAGSGGDILSSAELAQVAPLWIEPTAPAQYQLARWFLLLTPLLAFGTTVAAIVGAGSMALLAQAQADSWIYELLYAVSGVGAAVCVWLIRRSLLALQRRPAEADAD